MISNEQLKRCLPLATDTSIEIFGVLLNKTMEQYDIHTPQRIAAFIAQVGHESGYLKYIKENLNYSSSGLLTNFSKYFSADEAVEYARNAEKIANRVYANRMGNGDEASGDGWRYRGRGLIQITGRDNYARCGAGLGMDLIEEPTYLETPVGAVASAGWFWDSHKLNDLADAGDIKKMTKVINGGYNGLDDRMHIYKIVMGVLG